MSQERTIEQIRAHYEVERALAEQLRNARPAERQQLYMTLYDELYRRVPDHPQLARKESPEQRRLAAWRQLGRIKRFLGPDVTFLEVGAGDCALSFAAAALVREVVAVDVSAEITRHARAPENFRLLLSDGTTIPVAPGSIEVAYSNQLMEHLHPDDASRQLHNIFEALAEGGRYICLTPNRLSGPHDISKYFDPVATGFHLKEYTITELARHFRRAGFSRVAVLLPLGERTLVLPALPFILLEKVLLGLPAGLGRALAGHFPTSWLLGIRLLGAKGRGGT